MAVIIYCENSIVDYYLDFAISIANKNKVLIKYEWLIDNILRNI